MSVFPTELECFLYEKSIETDAFAGFFSSRKQCVRTNDAHHNGYFIGQSLIDEHVEIN